MRSYFCPKSARLFTKMSLSEELGTLLKYQIMILNIVCIAHILFPSHYKVKSDYLLIFIAKEKEGKKWSHITYAEKVFIVWKLQ